MISFIWSLGELGVKYHSDEKDSKVAHRRLGLVRDLPLTSFDELQLLSNQQLSKLVCKLGSFFCSSTQLQLTDFFFCFHSQLQGLVSTGLGLSKQEYLVQVISALEWRVSTIENSSFICQLTETLSKLRESIISQEESPTIGQTDANQTSHKEDISPRDKETTQEENKVSADLIRACEGLLDSVATRSLEVTDIMTSSELRRLMTVYSLSPLRADALVSGIEKEIEKRFIELQQRSLAYEVVREQIKNCASQAMTIQRSMHSDSGSPLTALKNGLKSLFRGDDDDESELESQGASEIKQIEDCLRSIVEVSEGVHELEDSLDTSMKREKGEMFELGQCSELISHYYRIDFESGQREARYNEEHRRNIAKRVFSRLLP